MSKKFVPPKCVISREAMEYMRNMPDMYNGIEYRIDIWTPEQMQAKLDMYGGKNRRFVKRNIAKLWNDMTGGTYKQDLRPKLVFDIDGNLIDGQHTFRAAIEAKMTLLLVSLNGAPSHMQDVIDIGASRSAAAQNEVEDVQRGKERGKWGEITQIARALKGIEGEVLSENAIKTFTRKHEKLLREIVKLSGDRREPGHQSVKLAPVRAAFFSYALHRGREGTKLVRRVMSSLREVSFRKGAAAKMLGAVVSSDYRTTNQSGSRSRRVLFPLTAATILAEERGTKVRSVAELEKMAANPATMVDFLEPNRKKKKRRAKAT